MNVLIFSVSMGGGHLKAAEAVKEEILARYPGSETMVIDTLRYVNPIIDKLIVGSYLGALRKTPDIYGKLYNMAENGASIRDFSRMVNKLLSFRVKRLINEFKPSAIICTHPFPLQMITSLKRKKIIDIPVMGIITDYSIHPLWPIDNLEAYVVANEHLKLEMVKRGYKENMIYPYGIPVLRCFSQKKDRNTLLKELELDDKLTALVMGGSLGFGAIKSVFDALAGCSREMQIIVITGKNKKLQIQLENAAMNIKKKIKILSYTNRVSEYMDAADFIITKPGGLTISEALVKELPIFLLSPIPGHEEKNAEFLINCGAAVRVFPESDMDSFLCLMFDGSPKLKHMKEMAGYLAKPGSAAKITDHLETFR